MPDDWRRVAEYIGQTVERSLDANLAGIRNDVQNIHIDLVKQMAAQQSHLNQVMTSLPQAFQRLAEENRILREENERLKAKLYMS